MAAYSPILLATKERHLAEMELDARQRLYAETRLQGSPPAVAARIVGYPKPELAARSLEAHPTVRQYMDACQRLQSYRQEVTREDVVAGLLDATRMAATATELTGAWREIGKIVGAYAPQRVELDIKDRRQIQELDDDQLAQLAAIDGEYRVLEFDDTEPADADAD